MPSTNSTQREASKEAKLMLFGESKASVDSKVNRFELQKNQMNRFFERVS